MAKTETVAGRVPSPIRVTLQARADAQGITLGALISQILIASAKRTKADA